MLTEKVGCVRGSRVKERKTFADFPAVTLYTLDIRIYMHTLIIFTYIYIYIPAGPAEFPQNPPRGVITCSPQFMSEIPARCSASDIIARGPLSTGLYICTKKKKNQSGYNYEWIMQRPLSSSSPPRRAAGDEAVQPKAKRPRAAQACDRCRMKKYKCDESYPCSHCKSMYKLIPLGKVLVVKLILCREPD